MLMKFQFLSQILFLSNADYIIASENSQKASIMSMQNLNGRKLIIWNRIQMVFVSVHFIVLQMMATNAPG